MAMERVTVEQNGERITLDVPEGTSDDAIKSYLNQQNTAPKTSGEKYLEAGGNLAGQTLGAVQAAADVVGQHPTLSSAASELALAAAPQTSIPVLKQAQQLAKAPINVASAAVNALNKVGAAPTGPVTPVQPSIIIPPNTGGVPRSNGIPNISPGTSNQTFQALGDRYSPITGATPQNMPAPSAPAPTIGGPAAQEGASFIQNITQKFAPMAARVAPVLQGASKMIAPAMIAKELYYTSPEDRAALQQMQQTHTTLKDWTKKQLGIQ